MVPLFFNTIFWQATSFSRFAYLANKRWPMLWTERSSRTLRMIILRMIWWCYWWWWCFCVLRFAYAEDDKIDGDDDGNINDDEIQIALWWRWQRWWWWWIMNDKDITDDQYINTIMAMMMMITWWWIMKGGSQGNLPPTRLFTRRPQNRCRQAFICTFRSSLRSPGWWLWWIMMRLPMLVRMEIMSWLNMHLLESANVSMGCPANFSMLYLNQMKYF